MVDHALGVVAGMWRVAGKIPREGGVAVYMTHCCGRGGHFAYAHSYFIIRWKSVEAANCQLGCCVREVITPDVDVCPDFV